MVRIINLLWILYFLYVIPKVTDVKLYAFEWDHLVFSPEKVNDIIFGFVLKSKSCLPNKQLGKTASVVPYNIPGRNPLR